MELHVLFLIVSYIAASADVFFIDAESSDLVLVKNYDKVWCVARGESAYSALSWNSPKYPAVLTTGFSNWDNSMDCNLMTDPPRCEQWSGWNLTDSIHHHKPSVLDYRWNDFRLITSNNYNEENNVPVEYQNNVWEITLSVAVEKDAYISLCNGTNPNMSGCYWIILGAWQGDRKKGCAIRRCPEGLGSRKKDKDCFINRDIIADKVAKNYIWTHVTLKLNRSEDLLLEVYVEKKRIMNWTDTLPLDISYLNVRGNDVKAYFRIHKYNYLLGKENQELSSEYFKPESSEQCWIIVYSFTTTAPQDAFLEVKVEHEYSGHEQILETFNETGGEWQLKKFIFSIKGTYNRMRFIIKGTGSDNTFAVGGIKQCSVNGDTRISKGRSVKDEHLLGLTCQALKYPEENVTFTSLNEEYQGCENCSKTCKQLGIPYFESISSCAGTSLCQNINNDNVCFCSAGYQDTSCSTVCDQRYGINCKNQCGQCKENRCDQENGTCYKGCNDGYRLPLCKTRYLILNNAPELFDVNHTAAVVFVTNFSTTGEGVPAKYKLQYKLSSQNIEENKWITEGTYSFNSAILHTIISLTPATKYAFRAVVIDNENGSYSGNDVPYNEYSTKCYDPENIVVDALRHNITINWKVGTHTCPVRNYTFVVEKDGKGVMSVSTGELPFNVTDLKPFTNYTWKLKNNGVVYKTGIKETLEDVPSEVQSLTIDKTTETSLTIKWESPRYPNGRVRHYLVQYEHCKYLACTRDVIKCSSPEENTTTSTAIQLQNLEPYSSYTVTVMAYTIGYGKGNSMMANTTGYRILEITPRLVEPSAVEKKEVDVYWALDCKVAKGKILGYNVNLKGISEWNEEYLTDFYIEHRDIDRFTAKFDNLQPYSSYRVSILVRGEDGPSNAEFARETEFTTKAGEPGKVRNAVAYSYGENWIDLRWEKPYPPTGELEHYELQYSLDGKLVSRTAQAGDYCSVWKNMICASINKLERDKVYIVTISAKNKDVNNLGEAETLNITTTQGVSDPPVNLSIATISSRGVVLTWKHPNITRGKLIKFEANVTLVSSGLKKYMPYKETKTLPVGNIEMEYTLNVSDLFPASQYLVEVYSLTQASSVNKTNSTISCKTPVSRPDIGSHLDVVPDSVTNTTFQITIPDPDKCVTNNSSYIIIVTSENIVTSKNNVPDRKLALHFKDNEMQQNILKEAGVTNGPKSWIAAEIKPGKTKEFVIGDNKTQESDMNFIIYARNRPLTPGGLYKVALVAVYMWEDDHKYRAVKLKEPVRTLKVYVLPDDSNPATAAWVVAVLLILCIPALVFWFIKRRRSTGKQERNALELKADDTCIVADTPSVLEPESSESKLPPSQRFNRRVAICDLEQYVKTGLISGELQRQHELFPRGQTRPWDYGKLPQNKTKNRYGNLVAYDETRVKLKKFPGDQFSDYINANYINGYNSSRFYIATQGPKRNTVVDFWRMIWQEHVQVIVMLANVVEDTKVKCEKYWPEFGQEVTHGAVTILNASNQIFADYTFRQLNVSCKGKTRKVHHLHYTSWPDHGVPLYPQSLASFLKKLLATSPGSGPVTVHCSAGVGRTGTVILSDICLRMAAAEGYVDMLCFLQQIREQRANMVDNLDQYKLVHLVLLECLVSEPSCYPCDPSFEKRVQELSNSGTIEEQFSHLYEIRWQDVALRPPVGETVLSPSHRSTSKNRNLDIVPGPTGRVYISPFPYDDPNSDYINAVYVDGFRAKDQFIVTQFPLESTVPDFWRLIVEKRVPLIVVLNEIADDDDDDDKSVIQFWPSEISDSMNPVPHITVTKKQERNSTYWKTHDVHIDISDDEEESRTVHILHLKDWRSDERLPPSTSVILELWQEAERLCSGNEPIAVCCFDGATACGYFVALAFLIEKIKLEQQCDVCQAVRTVRQNREHFVTTCDQFEYLYKAAVTYLSSFQIYANFN